MKSHKRSPLKSKPLRHAGQSLDDRIDKLINENAIQYVLASALFIMMAVQEWLRFYRQSPPSPKTITFFAIVVVIFSFYKIRNISREVKNLKLGRDGERIVGESLDLMRTKGYKIFHDIIGENFNIDHVIISAKGIFLIETKTFKKPTKKDARIYFNGKDITVGGEKPNTHPLTQISASAKWLKNMLKETTGKEFPIKPVVVFPGWFVETDSEGKKSNIWVLNPKALPQYIENEKSIVSKEDMSLASYHLAMYIRTKEESNWKQQKP